MNILVIDSSVIMKWLNQDNEPYIEQADKILQHTENNRVELIAPELAKYEIGNVLLKGKKLTVKEVLDALITFYSIPIRFISESEIIAKETYAIAEKLDITYYDAAFLSVAKQYNATLITDNIKHQGKAKNIQVVSLKDY